VRLRVLRCAGAGPGPAGAVSSSSAAPSASPSAGPSSTPVLVQCLPLLALYLPGCRVHNCLARVPPLAADPGSGPSGAPSLDRCGPSTEPSARALAQSALLPALLRPGFAPVLDGAASGTGPALASWLPVPGQCGSVGSSAACFLSAGRGAAPSAGPSAAPSAGPSAALMLEVLCWPECCTQRRRFPLPVRSRLWPSSAQHFSQRCSSSAPSSSPVLRLVLELAPLPAPLQLC
jgi:hypothetical protein